MTEIELLTEILTALNYGVAVLSMIFGCVLAWFTVYRNWF